MATVAKALPNVDIAGEVFKLLQARPAEPMDLIRELSPRVSAAEVREALWKLLISQTVELRSDGLLHPVEPAHVKLKPR
jgi:hypothetical protein